MRLLINIINNTKIEKEVENNFQIQIELRSIHIWHIIKFNRLIKKREREKEKQEASNVGS